MTETTAGSIQSYQVSVERQGEAHALASAHGHTLTLGARRGDPSAGFNAAETLLASLGTCLITNINSLAARMHLQVDAVRVEIDGVRRDKPPAMVQIRYRLVLDSPEPPDQLEKLHDLAIKWGTVTNTLLGGVAIEGDWTVSH